MELDAFQQGCAEQIGTILNNEYSGISIVPMNGDPTRGFTRYLMQAKPGEAYLKSDMSQNMIFITPFNELDVTIFSDDISERKAIFEDWNRIIASDDFSKHSRTDTYYMSTIDINPENRKDSDFLDIFAKNLKEKPGYLMPVLLKVSINALHLISEETGDTFDVAAAVFHGAQVRVNEKGESRMRCPHIHLLLAKNAE
jgi:hypothetical protein